MVPDVQSDDKIEIWLLEEEGLSQRRNVWL